MRELANIENVPRSGPSGNAARIERNREINAQQMYDIVGAEISQLIRDVFGYKYLSLAQYINAGGSVTTSSVEGQPTKLLVTLRSAEGHTDRLNCQVTRS